MSLEQFIATYSYWAILAGTFLEGETILVIGGFLAHRGHLELRWVIVSAFAGSLFGDQLYYYIGRIKGIGFLERRPRWNAASGRVLAMLRRHQIALILGFRFMYGLRTVTPFLIGAAGVPPLRYAMLNAIGAAIWAIAVGVAGYMLGHALELLLDEVKRYEYWVLACIAGAGALFWLVRRLKDRPAI